MNTLIGSGAINSSVRSLLLVSKMFYGGPLNIKPHVKPQVPFKRWNIVKGDMVKIRSGPDKGAVAEVLKVKRKTNQIIVKGVNLKTTYKRNPQLGPAIIQREPAPIHVSKAGLYDRQVERAVKIRYGFHAETGEKLRISKASGEVIPKPIFTNTREKRGQDRRPGEKDTPSAVAHKVTYQGEDFAAIKAEFEKFIEEKERKEKLLVFSQ